MQRTLISEWRLAICAFLLAGAAGCTSLTTQRDPIVLDPIGPRRPGLVAPKREGTLVVYGEAKSDVTAIGDDQYEHNFAVFSGDGSLVQRFTRSHVSAPKLSLPEGDFVVEIVVSRMGLVRIPVTIDAHRTTLIDVTGQMKAEFKDVPADALVKLPDGRVVGYRR